MEQLVIRNFIDGKWCEPEEKSEPLYNPSTGEVTTGKQLSKVVPEMVASEFASVLAQYSAPPWLADVLFWKLPPLSATSFAAL